MIPAGTKVSFLVSGKRKWGRVLVYIDSKTVLVSQDGTPTTQRVVAEAALTAPVPNPDPPKPNLPTHGISPGYKLLTRNDIEHDWELDQIRDVGAQFVRVDSTVSNQAQVERTVAGIIARGMEPLLILHGSSGPIPPATAASFVLTQGTKWKGRVRLFEFCNEPDMNGWTPDLYTAALIPSYPALKQAHPDAVLLAGALWKWADTLGYRTHDWVRRMYASGARGHFDALSLHLYDDPMARGDWNIWDWTFHISGCVREIMDANGDRDVPIVSTENGLPSEQGEAKQALVVTSDFKALEVYRAQRFVMHTVFSMTDDTSAGDFGLVRPDRSRRPAWAAYRNAAVDIARRNC